MSKLYKVATVLYFLITIAAGAFLFMFAGIDDSPGGQLMSLIVVVGGLVGVVTSVKSLLNQ